MKTTLKIMVLFLILVIGLNVLPGYAQDEGEQNTILLPLVMRNNPHISKFGVEVTKNGFMDEASSAGNHWVRYNRIVWSSVQPDNDTQFYWDKSLYNDLSIASNAGMEVNLIVRSTPMWAQKYSGVYCGPMGEDYFDEFANFMYEVVKEYSVPPYNVKHFEIWNEPDVTYQLPDKTSVFGCWGDPNDPYFGGGYYAEMLKVVYPAMKAANPSANLVLGGLLLDCDPRGVGTGYCPTVESTRAPKFFEGILKNGGGDYFDIVSFHGYPTLKQEEIDIGLNPIFREMNFYTWRAAGGVVEGKLDYINSLMAAYNISKPVFHTEGALLLGEDLPSSSGFEDAKANYLPWLYARNWSKGIKATNWYILNGPGWRQSALLDENQQPRPAYYAFSLMTEKLGKADFVSYTVLGEILTEPNYDPNEIHRFEFKTNEKRIWLLFGTRDNNSRTITIPPKFLQAYNILGSPVNPVGDTITFQRPIYIEMSK